MHGRDLDSIVTKCSNYRINLASQQNKVACDGGTSIAGRLEINGGRGPHRGRDFRSHIRYLLGTRNRDLVDAPVVLSFTSQRLVNLSAPGPNPGSQSCNQAGDCDAVFSYPMFKDLERASSQFAGWSFSVSRLRGSG